METGTKLIIGVGLAVALGGAGYYLHVKRKEDEEALKASKMLSNGATQHQGQLLKNAPMLKKESLMHRDNVQLTLSGNPYVLVGDNPKYATIWTTDGYAYRPTEKEMQELKRWYAVTFPDKIGVKKKEAISNRPSVVTIEYGNEVYLSFDTIGTRFYDTFSEKW